MKDVPESVRLQAVPAELAEDYALRIENAERDVLVAPAAGGTLDHFQAASLPARSRFWGDAHGKRGRKPNRPKGSETIRHLS